MERFRITFASGEVCDYQSPSRYTLSSGAGVLNLYQKGEFVKFFSPGAWVSVQRIN